MSYRRRDILESYAAKENSEKQMIISLLFDEEPSRIKLKYLNSLKQSYDGSVVISVSQEQMSGLRTS